ncbi:1-acyl-sn-glycerol-3-phosphate acyltransferase [bacterium]|nr:1-acyl-sn-glycerol-3-phosphate acyltransferase [bacterium]MBT5988280.1 1-acyl-sn-glycerol-3-phosphate acyltransferase [bacterium]
MKFIKNILEILFTIYAWLFVILAFLIHFIFASIIILFFKHKAEIHQKISAPIIKLGFLICGIRVHVQGLENLTTKKNILILSNHQSLLDILVYSMIIPRYFSFIAKKELAKVPIIGWDLKVQKHILIDRKNPRKALAALNEVKNLLTQGRSFLMFPEGTRSADSAIGNFKSGAFKLALESGVTIVPCYINGTNQIIRKKSLWIWPGKVIVKIGKPLKIDKIDHPQKTKILELNEQVKNLIIAEKER